LEEGGGTGVGTEKKLLILRVMANLVGEKGFVRVRL